MACRKQRLIDNLKKMNDLISSEQDELFTETLEKYENVMTQLEDHFESPQRFGFNRTYVGKSKLSLIQRSFASSCESVGPERTKGET